MSDLNEKVHALLLDQIERGTQLGTQVCAYRHGERIVDTWAGLMGPEDSRPVGPDSLFLSFSTTKGVAATALHILADRGIIDYAAPVAKYWPAFAQNGKGEITVAQAMSHQAGLHALPVPYTLEFVTDWEAGLRWIEQGTPAWPPGTATGYHAMTYAWIVGAIVQYATGGRHIKDVIREEIAEPLGVADEMFVGIPDGVEERLTTLLQQPRPANSPLAQLPPDHDMFKAMPPNAPFTYNDMAIRKACLPSANGHFTARALARMYAALANGGAVDGVRLVSAERIPQMYRCLTDQTDRVIMMPLRKGIGFFLGGKVNGVHGAMGPRETAFGHPGAGGSIAFADPDEGLAVAVTINKMQTTLQAEGPTFEICELIRNELGING
jgi:CubicO group peptidase (beta-lactamase class C family)